MATYPYYAELTVNGFSEGCGGTLIAPEWILTAAHCIDFAKIKKSQNVHGWCFRPWLPSAASSGGGGAAEVDCRGGFVTTRKAWIHPEFKERTGGILQFDFGLVRLDHAVLDVEPVRLWSSRSSSRDGNIMLRRGVTLTAVGMGFLNNEQELPESLQELPSLPYMPTWKCEEVFDRYNFGTSVLCTEPSIRSGLCVGDSGAPLLYVEGKKKTIQVGITSFGSRTCTGHALPDAFARVDASREWIVKTVCSRVSSGKRNAKKKKKLPRICRQEQRGRKVTQQQAQKIRKPGFKPSGRKRDDSSSSRYPWYAELLLSGESGDCAGTLIGPRWILTSAQCARDRQLAKYDLHEWKVGSYCVNKKDNCQARFDVVPTQAMYIHPLFDKDRLLWDVALIQLERRVNIVVDYLQLADTSSLLPVLPAAGGEGEVRKSDRLVGVGYYREVPTKRVEALTGVQTITTNDCEAAWGVDYFQVSTAVFCTNTTKTVPIANKKKKEKEKKRLCQIRGSPLFAAVPKKKGKKWQVQVGISSFGSPDCTVSETSSLLQAFPEGAARVDVAYEWIQGIVCSATTTPKEDEELQKLKLCRTASIAEGPPQLNDFADGVGNGETALGKDEAVASLCTESVQDTFFDSTLGVNMLCVEIVKSGAASFYCDPGFGFDAFDKCPLSCGRCLD